MIIDQVLRDQLQFDDYGVLKTTGENKPEVSQYNPDTETKNTLAMIIDCFSQGDTTLRKPRREFNDLSVLTRMSIDQMAFNIYQPNNGEAYPGDVSNSWRSNAVRPIVRNKVISIAAHATARMLFPKIFAYNENSDTQEDAANAMRDLIEWASDKNEYAHNTMYAVINALVNPISLTHIEYCESYRTVKRKKDEEGKWIKEQILDEDYSGFKLTPVPVDELYIANFYEENIQKQEWLIWRRPLNYSSVQAKYGDRENFKYVRPGYQTIYNDANTSFYDVYDANLHGSLCEEVIFYSKPLDLQIAVVNGIMMDKPDNPNPRLDKMYPFIAFGYENIDEGRAFYKKSLAFKIQPDADIINTLYPLIIDGTYLSIMPPMIIAGEEEIGTDFIIPGATTVLSNPNASIVPLRVAQDIRQGMETLFKVEESISASSQEPILSGASAPGQQTAYEISKIEQNSQKVLGLFIDMIGSYVRQYGRLVISDIIQYLTIAEVDKIIDNGELTYKTFIVNDRKVEEGTKSRKIRFDNTLPEEPTEKEEMDMSYDILEEEGDEELYKVNPALFRNLKYIAMVSPDVINPMSDDLERAFGLEVFDKSIAAAGAGVPVNMENAYKDFILANYPRSREDTSKYIKEEEPGIPIMPGMEEMQVNPNAGMATAGQPQSPFNKMMNNPLIK